jgi:RND family efflux transporter MFP subunit
VIRTQLVRRLRLRGLAFVPLLLAGCTSGEGASPGQGGAAAAPKATAVTTARPVKKAMTQRVEQPGEVRAYEQTPMYSRLSGYVGKVHKDIGDRVGEGAVLLELDVPELVEEAKEKKAVVGRAVAEVEQSEKLLRAAEAALGSAAARVHEAEASRERVAAERRRAESQHERVKQSASLFPKEALAEAQLALEAAVAAVKEVDAKVRSAEAGRVEAEAKRDKAKADVSVAKARQSVAEAEQGRVAAMLGYARMTAPFPGVVVRRNVDRGHSLQANGGKGEPVFVIARTDPVRVFVDVPEGSACLVCEGTEAVVTVQALPGQQFKGKVERTSFALDDSKGRTLRAEINLHNPDGALRPGMYAYATLVVHRADAWAVPASAVVSDRDVTYCYLVEGGKAVRTPVLTGFRDGQLVELLRRRGAQGAWEPITGQEEVIVAPPPGLADGQAVTPAAKP